MKKILSVVGARPNFMKMAPIHKELLKHKSKITHKIVHTGQHYDKKMSDVFFKELELPKPHIYLGVGSESHSVQTAKIMIELEKIVLKENPDLVIVYGDVNSTVAAGLVCSKILIKNPDAKSTGKQKKPIPLAHVESGLRSFDRTMPEEINRILTDNIAEFLFVTEKSGLENLLNEGFDKKKIFLVGNTMLDSLKFYLKKSNKSDILKELCISQKNYVLVTLHRPSNVDNKNNFKKIFEIFRDINRINPELDIVFPIHPRTMKMLKKFRLSAQLESLNNLIITESFGYLDFLKLMIESKIVLTDSGGIQEETTFLKIPCITLRDNTERPVTVSEGTNEVCGLNRKKIRNRINKIESGKFKKGKVPKLWDGKTANRIVKLLLRKIKRY